MPLAGIYLPLLFVWLGLVVLAFVGVILFISDTEATTWAGMPRKRPMNDEAYWWWVIWMILTAGLAGVVYFANRLFPRRS